MIQKLTIGEDNINIKVDSRGLLCVLLDGEELDMGFLEGKLESEISV